MNPATGHLTDVQIQDFLGQDGNANRPEVQGPGLEAHVADCESCRTRVLDAQRSRLGLLEGDRMRETPYPGCPAEETLQDLAAGIAPSEMVEATTEHAAHCDFCGPLLARYTREFSETLDEEESDLLGQLESSKPAWQKKFVRQQIKPAQEKQGWSLFAGFWPKLAMAAAAIAIAFGVYLSVRPNDLDKAQTLVASAYSERRTIEMRLTDVPYARYSPLPVQRGGDTGTSLAYQRPSLLRAGAAVGDKLKDESHPDPRWLQVKGRVDLLEGTTTSAADAQGVLEKARAQGLSNPSLNIDLAASSFERANNDENPDFSTAINFLRAALDDPKVSKQEQLTALFDLGIAYQRSKMFDLAIETWEKYLQLDSSSDWANEARERLESAKKAAPPPKTQSSLDLQGPLFFLEHLTDAAVLERLDFYQDRALRFWLPKAVQEPHGTFSQATHKLADLSEQYDSDPWLKELLASLTSVDAPAVQALSAAIRANKQGLYGSAVEQSRIAARIFKEHHNLPGELRARFESIYASQRFLEGFDCLAQIAAIQTPDRYRWLAIQVALEKNTCSNIGGDFAALEQGFASSRQQAEKSHYHLLALRSIALAMSAKRQQQAGCHEVWKQAAQGLDLYWSQPIYVSDFLYPFYSNLELCAAQMKMWHTAEALQRHCISLLDAADVSDVILIGSAHAELAAVLAAEYKDSDAELEQDAADAMWKQAGDDETAVRYRLFMRIHLAEIQLERGDASRALSTLISSRDLLHSTQYELFSVTFYRLLGQTLWRLNRLEEASSADENGISIAENALQTLRMSARDRLQWVTKMDQIYHGIIRIRIQQGRTDEAWKIWEWYRSRSLQPSDVSTQVRPFGESSWQRINAEIAGVKEPSEKHLIYASFEDGLETWIVDKNGVKAHWIQIRQSDLAQSVNDFAEHCADASFPLGEIHTEAQALYKLLLQPVISDLPESSTVVAEVDRTLSRLVLPALMTPEGRYFAEGHTTVYSPGVLMENNLRPSQPVDVSDRLLLLDGSESSGSAAVPGHLEERKAALQVYSHFKIVNGDQTNPTEIKSELSRSTVFDFIGHGELHGSRTDLRLNAKVSLTAQDFPPQALAHIKLGILAACSTGATGEDRLLDPDNLVHSFLAAGVPDVIASQWNVDSAATMQLMRTFHDYLGAGKAVPQAMYLAQREMLSARNHPYFWAGFNLSGRAN